MTLILHPPRRLSCLCLLLAAAAGCRSTDPPAGQRDAVTLATYPKITASDRLDKFLKFDNAIVTPATPTDPMLVEIPVRSTAPYPISVQYRYDFYDSRGRVLTHGETWVYKSLAPSVDNRLTGTGTDPDAVDYRLSVRTAR